MVFSRNEEKFVTSVLKTWKIHVDVHILPTLIEGLKDCAYLLGQQRAWISRPWCEWSSRDIHANGLKERYRCCGDAQEFYPPRTRPDVRRGARRRGRRGPRKEIERGERVKCVKSVFPSVQEVKSVQTAGLTRLSTVSWDKTHRVRRGGTGHGACRLQNKSPETRVNSQDFIVRC